MPSLRPTSRSGWLIEFAAVMITLGALTREIIFVTFGLVVVLWLGVAAVSFNRKLKTLREDVKVTHSTPKKLLPLGSKFDLELKISNTGTLSTAIVAIEVKSDKEIHFNSSKNIESLQPGSQVARRFSAFPHTRGIFNIFSAKITFANRESEALYQADFQYPLHDSVEVYPSIEGTLSIAPSTPAALYGEATNTNRKTRAGIDFAGIRNYMPGDEQARIAWKSTARHAKLMVNEFHPEIEGKMQILIDASTSMRQQSYVGTKFDEAAAVAELIIQTLPEQEETGIILYDETRILASSMPSTHSVQSKFIRNLKLPDQPGHEHRLEVRTPPPFTRTTADYVPSAKLADYMKLLRIKIMVWLRKSGVYKAIIEASTRFSSTLVILTDLNDIRSLLNLRNFSRTKKIVVGVIGADWRFCTDLELAYRLYEANQRKLTALQHAGIITIDVRPQQIVASIAG